MLVNIFMLGLLITLSKLLLFEMKNNLINMHPSVVAGIPTMAVDLQLASDVSCKLLKNVAANIAKIS
jgi:folate-dependent phosphoribosylglycinamide formyltransferase PurN